MENRSSYPALRAKLEAHDQTHLLRFWDQLRPPQREQLAQQIKVLDLDQLAGLIAGQDTTRDFTAIAAAAAPPAGVRVDGAGPPWTLDEARQRGEVALRDGQLGVVIVAGGQGTRLGFDQPKGMFPLGPVSGRTLFQIFADRIAATAKRYAVRVPLYLMTSDATDAATRDYFARLDYLGLAPQDVKIFKQGTMPAVDAASGKILLASADCLALSPDGHGGTVSALDRSGCLDDAQQRGIRQLAYIQVDNPLANLCDPLLLGHHLQADSEMTTQVIRKRYALEKVGNVVLVAGRLQIIEYSDLPRSAAEATDPDGQLKLWAGSIGVHIMDLDFLRRMSHAADALPFHRALKRVPHLDEAGRLVEPREPNAIKLERFIFDLLPEARNAFVVEANPGEAFAPVKNPDGAVADTPAMARAAIADLHRSWLERAGARLAPGIQVEINPRFSLSASELAEKIPANLQIDADRYFDA